MASVTDKENEMFRSWLIYIESVGEWLHGGYPARTALAWVHYGLTVEAAESYIQAGVFEAFACRELVDAGVSPAEAGIRYELGEPESLGRWGKTLGYWLSNMDLKISQVVDLVAQANLVD